MGPLEPLPTPEPPAPPEPPPPPRPFVDRLPDAIERIASFLPLALMIGLSPGVALFQFLSPEQGFLETNALATPQRLLGGAAGLASLAIAAGVYALLGRRLVRGGLGWPAALRRINGWLLPVLVLPLLPWLAQSGNETERPFLTLFFAVLIAAAAAVTTYRWPVRAGASWKPALAVTAVLATGCGLALTFFAVRQHHAFGTSIFDLAIYDNLFFQSSHGRPLATNFVKGGNHLSGHFDPFLVLLSPLYLLYPRAEFLLTLQAVWLASGAFPLFWLALRRTGRPWIAAVIAAAYLLHPALHGAGLYDFHSLTLSIPLVIAAIALLDAGRLRSYAVVVVALLLVREDVSLLLCFVGLWAMLSRKAPRAGAITIAVSVVYFVVVKALVMRTGLLNEGLKAAHSYAYYYRDLIPNAPEGSPGLFLSLLMNPAYVLGHMLSEAKVLYLGRMFLPVLLLPFAAPRARLMLAFGLVSVLLASRAPVFSLYFQYVATLLPVALAIVPMGMVAVAEGRLALFWGLEPRRLVTALAAGVLAASAVVSAEYGVLLPNEAFRAGFSRLQRDPTPEVQERYAWLRQQIDALPPGASVSATKRLVPHVSNRKDVDDFPTDKGFDVLLIERRQLDPKGRRALEALLTTGAYRLSAEQSEIAVYLRVPEVPLP